MDDVARELLAEAIRAEVLALLAEREPVQRAKLLEVYEGSPLEPIIRSVIEELEDGGA